jgi:hypothetical protein
MRRSKKSRHKMRRIKKYGGQNIMGLDYGSNISVGSHQVMELGDNTIFDSDKIMSPL